MTLAKAVGSGGKDRTFQAREDLVAEEYSSSNRLHPLQDHQGAIEPDKRRSGGPHRETAT